MNEINVYATEFDDEDDVVDQPNLKNNVTNETETEMIISKQIALDVCKDGSESSDEDSDDNNVDIQFENDVWLSEDETPLDEIVTLASSMKTKNEIIEVPADYPVELHIDPHNERLFFIGKVVSKIDSECTLVIQSTETAAPLNEGSVLMLSNGSVIGKIQEVFGPLVSPFYIVKWKNDIVELLDIMKTVSAGAELYSVDRLNTYVTPTSLRTQKGSDASNFYDEEVTELNFFIIS